jgi:glycosyltransferase involved in cell wall biosynthesis
MTHVTVFARVSNTLNPYILLFKETLEGQGISVNLEREFNLKWLLSKSKFCDCIHLHWINPIYQPPKRQYSNELIKGFMEFRYIWAFRSLVHLINVTIALFFARLHGKILVYTVHDLDWFGLTPGFYSMLRRIAHHVVMKLSHHIHVHNHYSRMFIETRYKRKDGVIVIPHGNYIGCYPNKTSKHDARRYLGLGMEDFVYLFFGTLRPYKGLEDLLDAFSKLEMPSARLLIAGPVLGKSAYKFMLEKFSKDNPAINLVPEFISDENIQLYMKACDICVLPYKHITTSGAAALASSFGRPIIAPAITCFPELVKRETGILYDPSDQNALTSALLQASAKSWSESKIIDYSHQFDWDKLGPKLNMLYRL